MKTLFIFILSFASAFSQGSELLSVYFRSELHYRDLDVSCTYHPGVRGFTLTAEVEDGEVVRARLRKRGGQTTQSPFVDLTDYEVKGLILFYSSGSQAYGIQSFTLSQRLILFFLYESNGPDKTCVTKTLLSEVSPGEFTFQFKNPYPLEEKIPYDLYSNQGVFKGVNHSGNPFRIELSLIQTR